VFVSVWLCPMRVSVCVHACVCVCVCVVCGSEACVWFSVLVWVFLHSRVLYFVCTDRNDVMMPPPLPVSLSLSLSLSVSQSTVAADQHLSARGTACVTLKAVCGAAVSKIGLDVAVALMLERQRQREEEKEV